MALEKYVSPRRLQYFKDKIWTRLTGMVSTRYTAASGTSGAQWEAEIKPVQQGTQTPAVSLFKMENSNQLHVLFKNPDNTAHDTALVTESALTGYDNADIGRQNRGAANESGWARVKDNTEKWAFAYAKDATSGNVDIGVTIETQGEFQDDLEIPLATTDYVDKNGGKIDKIKVNGTEQAITNKEVNIAAVEAKGTYNEGVLTQLELVQHSEGVCFIPESYGAQMLLYNEGSTVMETVVNKNYVDGTFRTETQVAQQIAEAQTGAFVKVASYDDLPSEGAAGKIYLVPNSGSGQNVYDEYIWCIVAMMAGGGGGESPVYGYEKIGTTAIDLSGYVQETDLVEITEAEIDAMFA